MLVWAFALCVCTSTALGTDDGPSCVGPTVESGLQEANAGAEDQAVEALRRMQIHSDEATALVRQWFDGFRAGMQRTGKPSVMEHIVLVHIARSGFLQDVPDAVSAADVDALLEASWFALTGKCLAAAKVIETHLPRAVMRSANYREKRFQDAVFRSERDAGVRNSRFRVLVPTVPQMLIALGLVAVGFARSALPGGEILAGAVMGYTVSAMAEWGTHRYLLHPSRRMHAFLKWLGGNRLTMAFRFHTGHHHGMFPPSKYSSDTNREWNEAERSGANGEIRVIPKRDETARRRGDNPEHLHGNWYGMSMNPKEIATASVNTMSVAAVLCYILGFGPEGYLAAAGLAPLTAFTTSALHPSLHMPVETANRQGRFLSWLFTTRYWRMVSQLHYQHHIQPSEANFSLFLPGPDDFFRTLRRPDLDAVVRMEEMGLAY